MITNIRMEIPLKSSSPPVRGKRSQSRYYNESVVCKFLGLIQFRLPQCSLLMCLLLLKVEYPASDMRYGRSSKIM